MIEFFKQRKIVIIIGILAIILIGWKIYNLSNFNEIDKNEMMISNTNEIKQNKDEEGEDIMAVHVTGEVKKPGVVKIKEGSRIEDAIKAAGGLTENADISGVNLAYVLEDGVKIRIPGNDEEESIEEGYITEDSGKGVMMSNDNNEKSSIININNASESELEELPGIGPSIANRIVEYREKNGKFNSIEDIKNVTGIGDSKFAKIKEFIKVK